MVIYLDTETTGISKSKGDKLVEIALLGETGDVLFCSLINPEIPIPFSATAIHGITNDMVKAEPTFEQLKDHILSICKGNTIIIFNADFETQWLPELNDIATVICAMTQYSNAYSKELYYGEPKFISLAQASYEINYVPPKTMNPHRALADCYTCKAVWDYLQIHTS